MFLYFCNSVLLHYLNRLNSCHRYVIFNIVSLCFTLFTVMPFWSFYCTTVNYKGNWEQFSVLWNTLYIKFSSILIQYIAKCSYNLNFSIYPYVFLMLTVTTSNAQIHSVPLSTTEKNLTVICSLPPLQFVFSVARFSHSNWSTLPLVMLSVSVFILAVVWSTCYLPFQLHG